MLKLLKKLAKNDNDGEISFIEVKALYDAAYAEKRRARVNLKRFKKLMSKAMIMDQAYRIQLATDKIAKYGRVV